MTTPKLLALLAALATGGTLAAVHLGQQRQLASLKRQSVLVQREVLRSRRLAAGLQRWKAGQPLVPNPHRLQQVTRVILQPRWPAPFLVTRLRLRIEGSGTARQIVGTAHVVLSSSESVSENVRTLTREFARPLERDLRALVPAGQRRNVRVTREVRRAFSYSAECLPPRCSRPFKRDEQTSEERVFFHQSFVVRVPLGY